jgi:hypothetical protein
VEFRIARRWIADFPVAMVGGSGCRAPSPFATLKFPVPQHESYPQALVLGLAATAEEHLRAAVNAQAKRKREDPAKLAALKKRFGIPD